MNPKAGCAGSILNLLDMQEFNHQVELTTGVLGEECSAMMKQFFKELREKQKKIKYEKTLKKEIVRLLIIGERKKKTTVTLKQDEIKKYFPPEYDEQKIRTVICQLLEEWSNQNH